MRRPRKAPRTDDQQMYSGLIRLHVLHHAAQQPVFGRWLIQELDRHGYTLSPGTLYPLLHGLEKKGYLRSVEERSGKLRHRFYRATSLGKQVLRTGRLKVQELLSELLEESQRPAAEAAASKRP